MTRAGIGIATSVNEVAGVAPGVHAIEDVVDDLSHGALMQRDALGGKRSPDDLLQAVVARRVHRDHLLLLDGERHADVIHEHDPTGASCRSRANSS